MIFGVISDTHGRRQRMMRVAAQIFTEHGADFLYHLGDDYADAELLRMQTYAVRAVPGLWCPEYKQPRIPNTLVDTVDWLEVACAHAEQDLGPRERAAGLVMMGHTHCAEITPKGRHVWLNPGHLRGDTDRDEPATYAVVKVLPGKAEIGIFGQYGDELSKKAFNRTWFEGGKGEL